MKQKIIITVFVLILAAACSRNEHSDAYGNFEAVEVIVSAEANGRLLWLDITEGMDLRAGDTLGLVDTTDLHLRKEQLLTQGGVIRAKLHSVQAQINVQQQQRENLMVDKSRLEKLFKDGAATMKQLDDINGALDLVDQQIEATAVQKETAMAELATLDVQVSQVAESLRKCWIVSPSAGTVLTKYAESGEMTAFAKPVCKLADLRDMELKIYISGDQLPELVIGREVEVLIDKGKKDFRQFTGKVSWISARAEFTPKTIQTKEERVNLVYAAKVVVPNDGSLKIGMPAEVNFIGK